VARCAVSDIGIGVKLVLFLRILPVCGTCIFHRSLSFPTSYAVLDTLETLICREDFAPPQRPIGYLPPGRVLYEPGRPERGVIPPRLRQIIVRSHNLMFTSFWSAISQRRAHVLEQTQPAYSRTRRQISEAGPRTIVFRADDLAPSLATCVQSH